MKESFFKPEQLGDKQEGEVEQVPEKSLAEKNEIVKRVLAKRIGALEEALSEGHKPGYKGGEDDDIKAELEMLKRQYEKLQTSDNAEDEDGEQRLAA